MLLTFTELLRTKPKKISNPDFGWRIHKHLYCQQRDFATITVRRLENSTADRRDWRFTDILRVTPYGIGFLKDPDAQTLKFLGIETRKPRDRSTDGTLFEWICPNTKKWVSKIGRFPIEIRNEEVFVSPPGVRTVNEEKRRAFNAKLKEVRTFFRVRAKLGVFDDIDPRKLRRDYRYLCGDKSFVEVLNTVTVDNLGSFMPLLAWMFRHWWTSDSTTLGECSVNMLDRFNATVDAERERCKLELGAITYEVPKLIS